MARLSLPPMACALHRRRRLVRMWRRSTPARALELFDESIALHRQFGDAWGLGILLTLAAGLRLQRGALDEAQAQASEALSLCEALDHPRGIGYGLDLH